MGHVYFQSHTTVSYIYLVFSFGGKKTAQKRTVTVEDTTFHLLHLSLLREYIDHEFGSLKQEGTLDFGYNLESIIDDWILMGFLIGNDFLPHLPHLHINKGALSELFTTYKRVLPQLGGKYEILPFKPILVFIK